MWRYVLHAPRCGETKTLAGALVAMATNNLSRDYDNGRQENNMHAFFYDSAQAVTIRLLATAAE